MVVRWLRRQEVPRDSARSALAAALVGTTLLLLGGCTEAPLSSSPTSASAVASGAISQDQVQSWITFRLVYGLRADIEWVLGLAQDPNTLLNEYGVPLLPDELARIAEANVSADNLVPAARRYAEAFPTFGGLWLELPRVVLAFTDDAPERRAEVKALFGDAVVVRQVQYSLLELRSFESAVQAERGWITSLGVKVIDVSLRETDNAVNVYYQAPTQGVEAQIRDRLGQPAWLQFEWAGPPPWTGPYGRVEIVVVNQAGQPGAVKLVLRPLDPRVRGYGPVDLEEGTFVRRSWPAVAWEADVIYVVDGVERTETKAFAVPPDGVAKVKVVLGD